MKKHLGLLFLFVMQNVCAMELDSLAMTLKYDEKCKLVAKYLYKYPAGRNEEEADKIKLFMNDNWEKVYDSFETRSKRVTLRRVINQYKNILHNIEAETVWHLMHEKYCYRCDEEGRSIYENIPDDIKQKIFVEVLLGYAQQCYVMYNSCKFIRTTPGFLMTRFNDYSLSKHIMPCFLAEIQDSNDQTIFIAIKKDEDPEELFQRSRVDAKSETYKAIACDNNRHMSYSDFNNKFSETDLTQYIRVFCCSRTIDQGLVCCPIELEKQNLKDTLLFLDEKNVRASDFQQLFNQKIKDLVQKNGQDSINEFIALLKIYKELPRTIALEYEDHLGASVYRTLRGLSDMYEHEINRKPAKKSAITCTINL